MSLSFAYNFWFIILGSAILALFTVWIYRTTTPLVSPLLRRFMLFLRVFTLIVLLALLFEPNLKISWDKITSPVVAVLIDNSASMQLSDGELNREQSAKQAISKLQDIRSHVNADFYYLSFADSLELQNETELDSLKFNSDGTNISQALNDIKDLLPDRKIAATVLISDGISNLGEDPVAAAGSLR